MLKLGMGDELQDLMQTVSLGDVRGFKFNQTKIRNGFTVVFGYNDSHELEGLKFDLKQVIDKNNEYSQEFIDEQLMEFIRNNRDNYKSAKVTDFRKFFPGAKLKSYEFYMGLQGVTTSSVIKLGEFELLHKQELKERLIVKNEEILKQKPNGIRMTEQQLEDYIFQDDFYSECIVGVKVIARDEHKASEIAKNKFIDFEKIFQFCTKRNVNIAGSIFYVSRDNVRSIKIGEDGIGSSSSVHPKSVWRTRDIAELYTEMRDLGISFVWELYSKISKNEIEERIISAILWTGMSNVEDDVNVKFMERCFAWEALLQGSTGFISPSITYHMSEMTAIILSNDYYIRKAIKANCHKMYTDCRSKLAHGSTMKVPTYYCELLWSYLIELIINLRVGKWSRFTTLKAVIAEADEIRLGKAHP